jgi:hypothetical protein
MRSRKYESEKAALEHLRSIGTVKLHGRAGLDYEYCVCTLTLPDGREYHLSVYKDGNVVLREK